jgi:hypothetical protein
MHPAIQQQLPIYDADGKLSLKLLNDFLQVSNEVTAEILGVSEGTVRAKSISHATLRKSQPLIHILNMLWELTDASAKDVRRWFYEPRVAWNGKCPMDLLTSQRIDSVTRYLEGLLDGEVLGS